MNPVEDQIRAATRAQASTLREVRPLRLTPAPARPPRRRRPLPALRWRGWLAPVTAAALVIAVAVALVVVRDLPNGRGVSPSAVSSATGAPPYYVALFHPGKSPTSSALAIGDTRTGARLVTIAAPRDSRFVGVTGAADDRTFVVATMPTVQGNTSVLAVTWYLLRIGPGRGYTLAKLAIPDMHAWGVQGIALSGSGHELAMTLFPAPYHRGSPRWVLRIYSVDTGKLLRSWSSTSSTLFALVITVPGMQLPSLNWVDGDRAVTFPTFGTSKLHSVSTESERLIDMSAKSGDLLAASRVIWSAKFSSGASSGGFAADRCLPLSAQVTANGKTVVCVTGPVSDKQGDGRVTLRWLAYSIAAPTAAPRVLYKVTVKGPDVGLSAILWSDASGRTLIIEWAVARSITASDVHFGVVSDGEFHALPTLPAYIGAWTAVAF